MNILVTYSSKTGNTKKLAEGIFEALPADQKTILPMQEAGDLKTYDIVLTGYWVDKGGPNEEAKAFLEQLEGKKTGLFATLAFWPDSGHAWNSLVAGEKLVKEKNTVIGKYICQGRLDEKVIEMFEKFPEGNPHKPTPEKRKRYKIAENHPSKADIAAAAELFCERVAADV